MGRPKICSFVALVGVWYNFYFWGWLGINVFFSPCPLMSLFCSLSFFSVSGNSYFSLISENTFYKNIQGKIVKKIRTLLRTCNPTLVSTVKLRHILIKTYFVKLRHILIWKLVKLVIYRLSNAVIIMMLVKHKCKV